MDIKNVGLTHNFNYDKKDEKAPSFKGVSTLKHVNIGACADGFIGMIKAETVNGEPAFLNVIKNNLGSNFERYTVINGHGQVVGEMEMGIKKYTVNQHYSPTNPDHVYICNLVNYSNPDTPFHNDALPQYKRIGTRLVQIAQRRSDEARCEGNIKLITNDESKPWFKKLGMTEEFPEIPSDIAFRVHNPNSMYLQPSEKFDLSRLNGGL